jgi:flagellar basal-body rod protein FlgF
MIEVQRAYEAGQSMLEREDDRINQLITAVRER